MSRQGFDRDTGQIFFDVTVPRNFFVRDCPAPTWAYESPFLPSNWKAVSAKGAHTLKHMVVREILSDQRKLTVSHLEYMTWTLARHLWQDWLCPSGKNTLFMWKLYATAYPKEFAELAPRHCLLPPSKPSCVLSHHAPEPRSMSTRHYLELVSSSSAATSLSWGTILTIPTEICTLPELFDVAKVTNLTALEISTYLRAWPASEDGGADRACFTDRILRSWRELAISGNSFKYLRLLVLRNQTQLTEASLDLLGHFPSLKAVLVVGNSNLCKGHAIRTADALGWKTRDKSDVQPMDLDYYVAKLKLDRALNASEGSNAPVLPCVIAILPRNDVIMLNKPENQRWFFRRRSQKRTPDAEPLTAKRKTEETVGALNDPNKRKKPTLRSLSSNHMKNNLDLAMEYLGGAR